MLACALLIPTLAAAQGDAKVRIAIVDFDTEAIRGSWGYGWSYTNLERAAADNLAAELVKSGKFRVIERQQLDKVLAEQNLGDAGRVDPSTAARIGKVLGVQLIVVGSVTEFGISEKGGRVPQIGVLKGLRGIGAKVTTGKSALTARLVDTTTAEILGAFDGSGSHTFAEGEFAGGNIGTNWDSGMASKVLAQAVKKLAADIASKSGGMTASTARGGLEGKVAKVDGDGVYLNVGAAAGAKPGDKFELRRLGEAIVDPDSGESLGGEEEVVGVVEIVKIIGEKLSQARKVQGGGFKVGDRAVMK
jgi:curli biogenesis system outer membrane secretion channel CsgG